VGIKVPPNYMEEFQRANLTFKHQRVFCPQQECLVMWNEPDESLPDETLVYIGAYLDPSHLIGANSSDFDVEIARGVARGELHPMTKAPLGSASHDKENIKVTPTFAYNADSCSHLNIRRTYHTNPNLLLLPKQSKPSFHPDVQNRYRTSLLSQRNVTSQG